MQPVNGVGGIMRFGTVVTIAACVLLSACASKPQDIELIAAPAHTYASYDCEQMLVEARNLVEEATSSYRAQVRRNRADKQTMIVGFFVTWPVTMLVEGDGLEATCEHCFTFSVIRRQDLYPLCSAATRNVREIDNGQPRFSCVKKSAGI
jgi:hypothetical protein